MASINNQASVTPRGGNIFADLGFSDSDEMLAKANLARHIRHAIKAHSLLETEVTEALSLNKQEFSDFMHNKLDKFTIYRLICLLNKLGCDVHLTVSEPRPDHCGKILVE